MHYFARCSFISLAAAAFAYDSVDMMQYKVLPQHGNLLEEELKDGTKETKVRLENPVWEPAPFAELVKAHVAKPLPPSLLNGPRNVQMKQWLAPGGQLETAYSLVVNMHNRRLTLSQVLSSIALTARGSFELILFCDGCNAATRQAAEAAIQQNIKALWHSAEADESCSIGTIRRAIDANGYLPKDFFETQDAVAEKRALEHRGEDYLNQCGRLQRVVLVDQPTAIFETAANNRAALISKGKYVVFMQDDFLMTRPGWNVQLSAPTVVYDDVFGVSARCAHGYGGLQCDGVGRCGEDIYGSGAWKKKKLLMLQSEKPVPPALAAKVNTFFVRPTGNRGPLLYEMSKFVSLGLFDEIQHLYKDDEHDLNLRAVQSKHWVNGLVPIQFHSLRVGRRNDEMEDNGFRNETEMNQYKAWRNELKAQDRDLRASLVGTVDSLNTCTERSLDNLSLTDLSMF